MEAAKLALEIGILIGTCVWNIARIEGATKSLREALKDMKSEVSQHRRDLRAAEKRVAWIEGRMGSHRQNNGELDDGDHDNG